MMPTRKKTGVKRDEHLEVLRAIWGEMKILNGRIEQTNARLDQTNIRLEAVRSELKGEISALRSEIKEEIGALRSELKEEIDGLRHRVVESEVRLATATTQLSHDVQELTGLVREWRHEHREDKAQLKARVERIEQHLGL